VTTRKGDLPDGWIRTTLGEAFKWASGGTPNRGSSSYFGGDIPWAIIGDLTDGPIWRTQECITEEGLKNSTTRWVDRDSILLAMYGSIGKLAIAKVQLTTNQAIAFTKTYPIPPEYLFWYLVSCRGELAALGKGGTQKNISQEVIKSFPLVLPPLAEQIRIVAEIDKQATRLGVGIESLKRVKAKVKSYRAAVLKAACEGRLVPTEAELARAEGRAYEVSEVSNGSWAVPLPEVPPGWQWCPVPRQERSRIDLCGAIWHNLQGQGFSP
jgi:type I restriction enzyme S subunit